jgi:ribosomal protein L7/L12
MAKIGIDHEENVFLIQPENAKEQIDIAVIVLAVKRLSSQKLSELVNIIETDFGITGTDSEIGTYDGE